MIFGMVTHFIVQHQNTALIAVTTNVFRKVMEHYKAVKLTGEIQTPKF